MVVIKVTVLKMTDATYLHLIELIYVPYLCYRVMFWPSMEAHACNLVLKRLRQKDHTLPVWAA